jgi:hypothetical protein
MKLYTEEQVFGICKYIAEQTHGMNLEAHNIDELKQLIAESEYSKTKLVAVEKSMHGSLQKLMADDKIEEIPMKVGIKGHELLELSKEELINKYDDYLTVGKLKEVFKKQKLSDDARVLVERVEDFYFENNHWSVYRYGGYWYWSSLRMNEKIDSGVFNDRTKYPKMDDPEKYRVSEKELHEMQSQYRPAFCSFKDEEHPEFLFINLHY